jgi:hypothetical protein
METLIIKTENQELDKVISESGLVLTEAEEIKQSYLPFFNQLAEIKEEAKKINFENPSMLDEKIARELRLRTVKVRTGSEEVKDNRKKIHMLKANVEQTSWNLIKSTCQLDEELFAQIEKKREREEAARKAALKIEREAELKQYEVDFEFVDLANMPEESYLKFLESTKIAQAQRIEAERIEKEERQAKEKAEAEERERIKAENERLKKETEENANLQKIEEERREKVRKEMEALQAKRLSELLPYTNIHTDGGRVNMATLWDLTEGDFQTILSNRKIKFEKLEADKNAIEEKAAKERLELEKAAAKLKAEQEARLKIAREEKEKIEAELKARNESEAKAKLDAEKAAEEELNKGDKEKFKSLMSDL